MGGGTRQKVGEPLSMGKLIGSTSLGCEGIAVEDLAGVRLDARYRETIADRQTLRTSAPPEPVGGSTPEHHVIGER
jgi:hypothetical protein